MKLLGIHDGHNASAALLINGEIVAAVSEERFSRRKNDWCYPKKAIEFCLKQGKVNSSELDGVLIASLNQSPILQRINRSVTFDVFDFVREQEEHWKPVLLEGKKSDFYQRIQKEPKFQIDTYYDLSPLMKEGIIVEDNYEKFREIRKKTIVKHLGISEDKVSFVNHHTCHAYYAYYASPIREDNVLILTADGFGDVENATIFLSTEDGLVEKFRTNQSNIGRLYRYMTVLLGMKMNEHEYKVMGLAPYAREKYVKPVLDEFRKTMKINGIEWTYNYKPKDHYFYYKDVLNGYRFDNIAGGLQKYTEELMVQWAENAMKKFKCKKVVFSGGVCMNVKVNKFIADINELDFFFVPPSGGDESISLGAVYYGAEKMLKERGESLEKIKYLENAYLGPEFSNNEIRKVLEDKNIFKKYKVIENPTPEIITEFLVEDKIIARCCGRMEFGARALGNRSIMANPSKWENVKIINDKIKFRDFWMPFTPSILNERANDYIYNHKGLSAPFMTIAFDTKEIARKHMPAAIHPADFTARPQVISREINPEYYDIIKAFENKTGIGVILNTSLNLHGEPIVCSPEDAIHTFENSELDMILIGKYLVIR